MFGLSLRGAFFATKQSRLGLYSNVKAWIASSQKTLLATTAPRSDWFFATTVPLLLLLFFSTSLHAATPKEEDVYTESKLNILVMPNHPQFTIKLKSNLTTGYSWFLREYDAKLIAPLKHQFQAPDTKLIGAPGYEVWRFRVNPAAFVVPQQTRIRFVYMRPWQPGDNPSQIVFRVITKNIS